MDILIKNASFYKIDESKIPVESTFTSIKKILEAYLQVEEMSADRLQDFLNVNESRKRVP